jgi:serine/threonine protein kinase/Tol biopolymer transport system component
MALTPGTKLGPYEIQSLIGSGGMGEVYRAGDTRLDRDVAIKILPASLASDQDRLHRFEQEARAVAALNHPNLLTVFDVGTTPLEQSAASSDKTSPYIVSELLEGASLRERLNSGALRERKAIDYAIQIARGLAAAHERGIVHRDIKPDNIFVTNDGRVKILDFGLAKLTETKSENADPDATLGRGTQIGVVMGTLGYMSPEQVRGKAADARSDIFSFGAVVYEMLSGKRAFRGDTSADLMSAILNHEPPELTATNTEISPAVDRIVHHCMEKDAQQRFQSAGDIAFQLNELSGLRSSSGAQALADAAAIVAAPSVAPSKSSIAKLAAIAALALAILLAITWYLSRFTFRRALPTFKQITFSSGIIDSSRFLPDGHTFVCVAQMNSTPGLALYIGSVDTPGLRPMNVAADQVESVSASGELLIVQNTHGVGPGYVSVGTLSRMGTDGGAPRPVLDNVQFADWAPSGKDFAVVRFSPARNVYTLEYPVGHVLYQTNGWVSNPHFSRDGKFIAFQDHPVFGDDLGTVAVVDMQGAKKDLSPTYGETQHLAWSPDGKEIWFNATASRTESGLYATTLSGNVRPLLTAPGRIVLQDVRADGDVLLDGSASRRVLMVFTPEFPKGRDFSWLDWPYEMRFSRDGKQIIFGDQHVGPQYGAFLRNLDGSPAVSLGPGDPSDISNDGKFVISRLPVAPEQLMLLPTGTGEPRQLTHSSISHLRARFLPDGRYISIGSDGNHRERSYVGDIDGKETPLTPEGIVVLAVSPDGKQLLTGDTETQTRSLTPFDGGPSRPLPQLSRDDNTIDFTADGAALLVARTNASDSHEIWRVELSGNKRTLLHTIDSPQGTALSAGLWIIASRDGKSYAYQYHPATSTEYLVHDLK